MFGTLPHEPPCSRPKCSVCSICQSSFDLRTVGAGPGGQGWLGSLRYGEGLYLAPNSSKANDYNASSERFYKSGDGEYRQWRCMFLSTVVMGRAYTPRHAAWPLGKRLPAGYDSVDARPADITDGELNFPEVVVYDHRQCIPAYLIVYSL